MYMFQLKEKTKNMNNGFENFKIGYIYKESKESMSKFNSNYFIKYINFDKEVF